MERIPFRYSSHTMALTEQQAQYRGEETIQEAMINEDTHSEWKAYCQSMTKLPKDSIKLQLGMRVGGEG